MMIMLFVNSQELLEILVFDIVRIESFVGIKVNQVEIGTKVQCEANVFVGGRVRRRIVELKQFRLEMLDHMFLLLLQISIRFLFIATWVNVIEVFLTSIHRLEVNPLFEIGCE